MLSVGAGLTADCSFSPDDSYASAGSADCAAVAAEALVRARADLESKAVTPPDGTLTQDIWSVPAGCGDELDRVDAVLEEERMKLVTWDVRVDRSRFYIVEQGPEPALPEPDYLAKKVKRHPGQITVPSPARYHVARVALKLADRAAAPKEGDWQLLSASDYRPVHKGHITVSDGGYPLAGISASMDLKPSELHLDPAKGYRVHIYASGRDDSAKRRSAAAEADDSMKMMAGPERYYVVFVPLDKLDK
ncbi:hypothetical protein AB0Q95_05150 [Streptomyces sp. NPDC059900]|uniref:hypothetical protein n=1 Tax=Streptomyces sp. NPDC059900 TaxID=3155816 RepID=UPI003437A6AA